MIDGISNQLHGEDNMASKMIVSHDPGWAKAYADEAAALEKAFGLPFNGSSISVAHPYPVSSPSRSSTFSYSWLRSMTNWRELPP